MASQSTAVSSDPAAAGKTEPAPSSQHSRPVERRVPTVRETLATLPEVENDAFGLEPHDTIPAPPWLDDEMSPTHEAT